MIEHLPGEWVFERIWRRSLIADGGCRRWNGSYSGAVDDRRPTIRVGKTVAYVARLVLMKKLGRPLRPGRVAVQTCGHTWCIADGHLVELALGAAQREAHRRRRERAG